MPRRSCTTRRSHAAGNTRSCRQMMARVGTPGQRSSGPRLLTWRLGLSASTATERFVREVRRHVVVEHRARRIVLVDFGLPGSGRKHLLGRLVRRRHHAGDEHDQPCIKALGHQRRNVASERLSNDHHVRAAANRVDDLGVIPQAGLIVFDWQIGDYGEVAVSAQLALDNVLIPADVASTVDEGKRCSCFGPLRHRGHEHDSRPNRLKGVDPASRNYGVNTRPQVQGPPSLGSRAVACGWPRYRPRTPRSDHYQSSQQTLTA
jgi:hypothetical protein